MARIVVGIDGSEESKQALAWALDEARRRGSELSVLYAYPAPSPQYAPALGYPYLPGRVARDAIAHAQKADEAVRERAREQAEAVIDGFVRDVTPEASGVTWTPIVLAASNPARALVQAARGADLLVVGSRGLGTVAGRVLGSVSKYCVRHAPCPVVVVGEREGAASHAAA